MRTILISDDKTSDIMTKLLPTPSSTPQRRIQPITHPTTQRLSEFPCLPFRLTRHGLICEAHCVTLNQRQGVSFLAGLTKGSTGTTKGRAADRRVGRPARWTSATMKRKEKKRKGREGAIFFSPSSSFLFIPRASPPLFLLPLARCHLLILPFSRRQQNE